MRRWVAPAVATLLLAGLAVSFIGFRRHLPYATGAKLAGNPEVVLGLSDVEVVGRSQGRRAWSFHVNRVDVAQGRTRTTFLGIKDGRLYDGDEVLAKVNAGRATYDSVTGDVEVTRGVEVVTPRGFSAATERALWFAYPKRLACPEKVTLRLDESRLVGDKLMADLRQDEITLENGKLVISMPDVETSGGQMQ